MSNVLIVAKKEFSDLSNSKLVLIILAFYMLMLITSVYTIYINVINNPKALVFMEPGYDACYFGSLVAIVLGFSTMSAETSGNALNTILVKPLYRDSIINGKIIGAVTFLSWVFWITVAIYTLAIYLIIGNSFAPYIILYLERLPFIFVLYLLCSILFYSLSISTSILFKNQSFALFIGLLLWIILIYFLHDTIIVQNLTNSMNFLFGSQYSSLLDTLSPISMIRSILAADVNDIGVWIFEEASSIFILVLYCFVSMILAYTAFLKRDVT